MADLASLARNVHAARKIRDRDKVTADASDRDYRESMNALWDAMEDAGVSSFKLDIEGGGTVRLDRRETVYGRVIDIDALREALRAEGREEELTKVGVESQRLNEMVRERLETNQQLPDGADWYARRYIAISER